MYINNNYSFREIHGATSECGKSTTLQRMNATILRPSQVREVDLGLNDHVFTNRHTSHHDMTV
jgi:hypothetical protein